MAGDGSTDGRQPHLAVAVGQRSTVEGSDQGDVHRGGPGLRPQGTQVRNGDSNRRLHHRFGPAYRLDSVIVLILRRSCSQLRRITCPRTGARRHKRPRGCNSVRTDSRRPRCGLDNGALGAHVESPRSAHCRPPRQIECGVIDGGRSDAAAEAHSIPRSHTDGSRVSFWTSRVCCSAYGNEGPPEAWPPPLRLLQPHASIAEFAVGQSRKSSVDRARPALLLLTLTRN